MTRACHAAVRMATGEVFTDEEIDQVLERMADRAWRMREASPTLSRGKACTTALDQLTREAIKEAMLRQRSQMAAEAARFARAIGDV